mmetsp:Transcript_39179/g.89761  ORF Transcript_39179/g.89761 Transcript_39179/m.89761 type:complete len:214 (+) Transcript_39179:1632-2273(+)
MPSNPMASRDSKLKGFCNSDQLLVVLVNNVQRGPITIEDKRSLSKDCGHKTIKLGSTHAQRSLLRHGAFCRGLALDHRRRLLLRLARVLPGLDPHGSGEQAVQTVRRRHGPAVELLEKKGGETIAKATDQEGQALEILVLEVRVFPRQQHAPIPDGTLVPGPDAPAPHLQHTGHDAIPTLDRESEHLGAPRSGLHLHHLGDHFVCSKTLGVTL